MLGGEVVENKERVAVFRQALDGLLMLDAIGFDERIERSLGGLSGIRHPDVLQCAFGLGLQAVWQLVQDIRGFVHPAALRSRFRPHLVDRFPEAERTAGDAASKQVRRLILERALCRVSVTTLPHLFDGR